MENISKKQFEKLLRNFVHHRGKGGLEEHAPVDSWDAGFMTPEMLKKLNQSSGVPTFLEDDTNVFELKAGSYITWSKNMENSNLPENAGFLVEVTVWNNVKIIKAYNFDRGREYEINWDVNGSHKNLPEKWGQQVREYVLYDRPFFGKGTTVELRERVDRFSELIIMFRHNTELDQTVFLPTWNLTKYGLSISTTNIASNKAGIMINEVRLKVDEETKKMLTIQNHVAVNIGKNHLDETTHLEKIEIVKIIGRL
ncbi:hypothetical protein IR073_06440 [Gemella sp. 19428wG2_WT2a]|nr:hypothetical protein [Gemella sp. 19428wG2_WT2a]TFU57674.1 hypothetical protein E4T67_06365 [Gemella sp. WT2a]